MTYTTKLCPYTMSQPIVTVTMCGLCGGHHKGKLA